MTFEPTSNNYDPLSPPPPPLPPTPTFPLAVQDVSKLFMIRAVRLSICCMKSVKFLKYAFIFYTQPVYKQLALIFSNLLSNF